MLKDHKFIKTENIYDREGSTLGIMDDLQIAIHSYDGCAKGCSGCIVDKHFKNRFRFKKIIPDVDLKIIQKRVEEYYKWIQENLNTKDKGYFGKNGYKVNHYSYTYRFGNHSELPYEELEKLSTLLKSQFKVFSTAPTEDISNFIKLQKNIEGEYFLEIIYDPINDDALEIKNLIIEMRKNNILGYPEVLITRRLIDNFTPKDFVEKKILPFANIGTQIQFGRYSPSKTRNFNATQVVPLDEEVEWLKEVSKLIVEKNMNIHPIPIGEYAVTLLDEYGEYKLLDKDKNINEKVARNINHPFDLNIVKEITKDIFMTSLYIDHNLDLYIWSESMGQHVLDDNLGFESFGNIRKNSISDLLNSKKMDKLLNGILKEFVTHPKCRTCGYKSFCASHAIPLFRKWHEDSGKHCYGYLPVIREFQKSDKFLINMIDGFKELGF